METLKEKGAACLCPPLIPGRRYTARAHRLLDFPAPDPVRHIMQGNLFDGEIITAAFFAGDDSDAGVVLLQLDAEGKFLRVSEPMKLYHANNICYVPKMSRFLVTHCQGGGHFAHYSLVDPVTLTETANGQLERPFFAMGYSPERDEFGSGEWAGETVDVFDGDLHLLRSFSVERPSSLSQGCFCDRDYIWFVRSSVCGSGCELRLYDWGTGALAFAIPIERMGVEPEALSVVDGVVYVLCNNEKYTGGAMFALEITETE